VAVSTCAGRGDRAVAGEQLREEILDCDHELLIETGHAQIGSIRLVAQRVG